MYRATVATVADHRTLLAVVLAGFATLWFTLLQSPPVSITSSGVVAWWTALCAVSLFNLCGWRVAATSLARRKGVIDPLIYTFQRRQLALSAFYVVGCGFRAILPRADVQRMGLYDSWVSSVMVGRSVATIAELCFVAQWALLLYAMAKETESRRALAIAWVLVPLIAIAEIFSWSAVLTTCYLGNAIEESLWAVSGALLVIGCLMVRSHCKAGWRPFLNCAILLGAAYVTFMVTVDVPMYVSRWLADEEAGRCYLSLSEGCWDLWSRRHVTFAWDAWRTEIPWMTLYFSVGVWSSIALVQAPWHGLPAKRES